MPLVTRSQIEALEKFNADSPNVMSCFANLSVQNGSVSHWNEELKHPVSVLRQKFGSDEVALKQFNQNIQDVLQTIENSERSKVAGMAVYHAHTLSKRVVLPLSVPVKSDVIIDFGAYLVPLLEVYFAQALQYLAIVSDLRQVQLFQAWVGGQKLLETWPSDIPSKQHSSGERGGWAQSKIEQHREEWIEQYLQEIVEKVKSLVHGQPSLKLILLGQRSHTQHLRNKLPNQLQDQVISEQTCVEPHSTSAVEQQLHRLVLDLDAQFKNEQLKELDRRRESGLGFATGTRDVLAALDQGRLEHRGYLLMGPDPRGDCLRCTSCRNLCLDQVTACPRCQSPCVRANVWEELMLRALRHNWQVVCYSSSASLRPVGEMALLFDRADQPQPRHLS
jgi:peptide subunit release factor 1 (eRF1)